MKDPITCSREKVAIVILNWNGSKDTLECLKSIQNLEDAFEKDVIVVDNHSSDDSVQVIKEAFPQFKLIESEYNRGFAGGNNLGIQHALEVGADYIVVLNNDTICEKYLVKNFVEIFHAREDVGIVGPKIHHNEDKTILYTAGGELSFSLFRGFIASQRGQHQVDTHKYDAVQDIQWVDGCCFCVRRQVFEQIGVLDEAFFLYWDVIDFCLNATKEGWKIVYNPHARLWHKGSVSVNKSGRKAFFYLKDRLIFHRKQMKWKFWLVYYPVRLVYDLLRSFKNFRMDPIQSHLSFLKHTFNG